MGLVIDKHPHDLYTFAEKQVGTINKKAFMVALESSICHLHSLGSAHYDLTPHNIMVSKDGMPVLIDFGGCQPAGITLKFIRGT
jgi:tRNA A-37 threonylcarbamoyl transferase component Bud32